MLQHCYIAHSTIKKSDGRTKRCTQRAPQSVYDCMLHDVFWMRDVASDCCRLPVGYVASNMWRGWRHCSHYCCCCCLQLFMAACSVLQLSLASCCAAPLAALAALLGRTANSASFFILKVIKVKMATATDGGQRRMQQRQQQLLQLQLQ